MSETRPSTWNNFNQDLIDQFRANSGKYSQWPV